MKDWHKLKPELFKKQPYYLPGCDKNPVAGHPELCNKAGSSDQLLLSEGMKG